MPKLFGRNKLIKEQNQKIDKLEKMLRGYRDELRNKDEILMELNFNNKQLEEKNEELEKEKEKIAMKFDDFKSNKVEEHITKTKKWLGGYYGEQYGK